MKIKPLILTLKEDEISLTSRNKLIKSISPQKNSYIKNLNQGDSISFRKDQEKENIYHPTNVTIVTSLAIREEYNIKKKRHHAHAVEDEEPPKKMIKEQIEDHVLISALLGSISPGEETWIIDSGASKNMKIQ
jgi:hypothetical protein